MALQAGEIDWITRVSGLDIDKTAKDAARRSKKKDAFLGKVIGEQLASVRGQIDEAQDFSVTLDAKGKAKGDNVMKWRARDEDTNKGILQKYELRADVEVDTRADIRAENAEIPMETLAKLEQAFGRIKEIEKSMKLQFDDNGEPLFTEAEIRNELWTPLVRSGLIPDNMVPDQFSEHAVAFEGARALYADKIEKYSADRTKTQDRLKRALRISKEVVSLAGSLASGAVAIANIDDIGAQKDKLKAANIQLNELKAAGADANAITAQTEAITKMKENLQHLEKMAGYAELGATILVGGLGMVEVGVDHYYDKSDQTNRQKWINTFKKASVEAQKMIVAAIDVGMRGSTKDGGYNTDGLITLVKCGVSAAFNGANVVATFTLVVGEKDDKKRRALLKSMIGELADTIADSINAAGGKAATGGENTDYIMQGYMQKIAAGIKLAMTQAAQGFDLYEAATRGDTRSIAMILGGMAAAAVMGASTQAIYDGIRADQPENTVSTLSARDAMFKQDVGEVGQYTEEYAVAEQLETIQASLSKLDPETLNMIRDLDLSKIRTDMSAEELEAELTDSAVKKQQQIAQDRMAEALTPEAMAAVLEDADAEVAIFGRMYSDAFPDSGLPDKPAQEIIQAQKAIDRAMANTEALRQRVAIINGITAAGAAVLAAIVPGTGAVVAAQKVAMDIYTLVKCVETHNAWVDSMKVAMAGQGGVTAAIENTLDNARIHLSHASVKLVLDTLKCSAEVARCFDPTGAATGVSAGASMAAAVVDFGYAMHTERAIDKGWKAYKDAIDDKGNRKAARQALRLNSTLAKCCIAYGASIMGDTAAKEAMSKGGLTIAALKDDKDICVKLVNYLEHQLNEDPNVMKVDYSTDASWHPGTPAFTLASWTSFKAAAAKFSEPDKPGKPARPPLAAPSLKTDAIDRLMVNLAGLTTWSDGARFQKARDQMEADEAAGAAPDGKPRDLSGKKALVDELTEAIDLLARLDAAFGAYAPICDVPGGPEHKGMKQVAATFATMARGNLKVAQRNLKLVERYPDLV